MNTRGECQKKQKLRPQQDVNGLAQTEKIIMKKPYSDTDLQN